MSKLDEYFGGATEPKKKRKKLPECTDTGGEVIKRCGPVALKRVLNDPGPVTAVSQNDYALVYCEKIGVGIWRHGARIRTAEFILFSIEGHETVYKGAEGRDRAVDRFLRMLRKGKVYNP